MGKAIAAVLILASISFGHAAAEPPLVLQQRHDAARARSWTLTRDGVLVHDAAGGRKVMVSLPGWLWVDDPYCAPDLAIGPNGEAVVTSNVIATLWRIDPRTLGVSAHPLTLDVDADKDVGFAAIVYSPDQDAYLAYSDVQRTHWKIDTALKTGTRIQRAGRSPGARCIDRQP